MFNQNINSNVAMVIVECVKIEPMKFIHWTSDLQESLNEYPSLLSFVPPIFAQLGIFLRIFLLFSFFQIYLNIIKFFYIYLFIIFYFFIFLSFYSIIFIFYLFL